MKRPKLPLAMILADDSSCYLCCITESVRKDPLLYDNTRQIKGRLTSLVIFTLVCIVAYFAKFFSETMFIGVYYTFQCYTRSLIMSCFQLMMIYRISTVMAFWILISFFVSFSSSRGAARFLDLCWLVKLLILLFFWYMACLIPNSFFSFFSAVGKFTSIAMVAVKIILVNDGLFFYFNKRRYAYKTDDPFSRCWKVTSYTLGFLFFVGGLVLFIFCCVWYSTLCTQYIWILIVMFSLSVLIVLLNIIKYQFRLEVNASFVMFFVLAVCNWGILSATPYTTCINYSNINLLYSKVSSSFEVILNAIFLCFALLFVSTVSLSDVYLTLSIHGRGIYKIILVDQASTKNKKAVEESKRELLMLHSDDPDAQSRILNDRPERRSKRPKVDIIFYLLMIFSSLYISMLFTSWTSLYNVNFNFDDIIDNYTLWLRLGGTLLGMLYMIVLAITNFSIKDKY